MGGWEGNKPASFRIVIVSREGRAEDYIHPLLKAFDQRKYEVSLSHVFAKFFI